MSLKQDILKTSFSALQVLQYVHDFESFSVAAARLNVTQSTVSYTIGRLRKVFNDPLFVREGNRAVPTRRCKTVVAQISALLDAFEGLTSEPEFLPSEARGMVTISCNHYERLTILPEFIRQLRARAPHLQLRCKTSSAVGEEQLKRGECDLLLGPVQLEGEHLFKRHVRMDSYVYLMDPSNPLASGPLTLDNIGTANHLIVQYDGGWQPLYISVFRTNGIVLKPMVEISDYGDLASYLAGTDLVACLPRALAQRMDPRLVRVDPPIAVPLSIDMFWTTRTHSSKLHGWVRSLLVKCAQESP